MFHQIELLPIAYFTVLMWVVVANVAAKIFGPLLIDATSGEVQRMLSRQLNVSVTGDGIVLHLFERQLIADLNRRLVFMLGRALARLFGGGAPVPSPIESFALQKILIPEQYWSGCPPNRA